jgi:hypothetical protein
MSKQSKKFRKSKKFQKSRKSQKSQIIKGSKRGGGMREMAAQARVAATVAGAVPSIIAKINEISRWVDYIPLDGPDALNNFDTKFINSDEATQLKYLKLFTDIFPAAQYVLPPPMIGGNLIHILSAGILERNVPYRGCSLPNPPDSMINTDSQMWKIVPGKLKELITENALKLGDYIINFTKFLYTNPELVKSLIDMSRRFAGKKWKANGPDGKQARDLFETVTLDGRTPLEIAMQCENKDMIKILMLAETYRVYGYTDEGWKIAMAQFQQEERRREPLFEVPSEESELVERGLRRAKESNLAERGLREPEGSGTDGGGRRRTRRAQRSKKCIRSKKCRKREGAKNVERGKGVKRTNRDDICKKSLVKRN